MSRLDNILLKQANKVLEGKQEKLGDYIDPTKQQIKGLFLELMGENYTPSQLENDERWHRALPPNVEEYIPEAEARALNDEFNRLRQKVEEL